MLKALELNGFKSFADRTQFTFDAGITVVVGPNGSGKSNVVDAIKWALGTQSAKSLRGNEMADVIFSGSASRRPCNAAEATLTFDNASGIFDVDAPEVELTRRTYRSGEVEYLVNRQVRRLRDLRDILSDAGLATSAYCVIEQGKVDALLQSTPKQRRVLFEEAAGVNRFKTKREEAARRLERVQQNLLRLADLADEVHERLRAVRAQAGKARKYSELASRLQFLRIGAALSDYRGLSQQIARLSSIQEAAQGRAAEYESRLIECEEAAARAGALANEVHQRLRQATAEESSVRQKIARCLADRSSQLARIDELASEQQRIARQTLALSVRIGEHSPPNDDASAAVEEARATHRELAARVERGVLDLGQLERRYEQASLREEAGRNALESAQRESLRLANLVEVLGARTEATAATLERCQEQETPLAQSAARLEEQRLLAQQAFQQATAQFAATQNEQAQVRERVAAQRRRLTSLQRDLAESHRQLAAVRERAAVLEELERRLDGLTAGAREALRCAALDPDGPFGAIRGVVADLLEVDADSSSMIEAALGERASYLVVTSAQRLCAEWAHRSPTWPGRVSFLRLDAPAPASAVDRVDLTNEPGVIGRADHFVQTSPELEGLSRRLLGRYWLVDTLETAFALSADRGRGLSYVTSAGEVVSLDGTLVVGPQQNATGLLSRRRELRSAALRVASLSSDSERIERECDDLVAALHADEARVERLSLEIANWQQNAGECRPVAQSAQQRFDDVERQLAVVAAERLAAEKLLASLEAQRASTESEREEVERSCARWEMEANASAEERLALAEQRAGLTRDVTEDRIALAGADQRREGLERQIEQLVRDRRQRDQALAEMHRWSHECSVQKAELLHSVLALSGETTELYRVKEGLCGARLEAAKCESAQRTERDAASRASDFIRSQLLQQQRELQKSQLELQHVEQQRTALAERIFEDYHADLRQLASDPSTPEGGGSMPARADAEQEMSDLRQALKGVGAVNLESLDELQQLEERWQNLASQRDDLNSAQERLARLVAQLNGESRQLFATTIGEIRSHFQQIFATLFEGGEADIVVEDDEGDILECGVNIMARPPGKQPRNISLLSGGERTLTCVALLLAVFKSRPSPFCVLDEVDAALDEANIDRFVKVVKEFMHSTQFIIVTHSKRTMSCSDTIYGVTMQESGVSKRVSVRFEDVDAKGRLRAA